MAAVAFHPLATWDALGMIAPSGSPSPSADSMVNFGDEEMMRRALEGTSPNLPRARLPEAPPPAWLPPPPMGSASLVQHPWSPSPPISQGPWSGLGFSAAPFAPGGNVWSPQPQQPSPAMSQNGFVSGAWDTASVLATMNAQHQHMVATGLIPAQGFAPAATQAAAHVLGSPNPHLSPSLGHSPVFGGLSIPMSASSSSHSATGSVHGSVGLGAMGAMAGVTQTRTVYLGNLPNDASVDELLTLIRFGPIDAVKILPEKSCAFISFLDAHVASAFHADAIMRKLSLHGLELKIGWGKPSAVAPAVAMAVTQSGASRNVYLGNLPASTTEQDLRDDLQRFGFIDQVKIVRDKNIGFVHFLSIATAMTVVATLPQEPDWAGRRVNFGKDRCAYVPKNQHQQAAHNLQAAQMAATFTGGAGVVGANLNVYNQMGGVLPPGYVPDPNAGNRTVYLGSIHPDTTLEEVCNAIRGGILEKIRYLPEKHICFVTFIDPNAALAFMALANIHGVNVHQRRLKVGWGKHPGPPPPAISMAVQAGGSRNLYIGNLTDFETYDEARLREDFGAFGDIECVNSLKDRRCAFIGFTQISSAIKALEGMRQHPDYAGFKLHFGKDRCGNAPRNGFGGFGGTPRIPRKDGMSPQMGLSPRPDAYEPLSPSLSDVPSSNGSPVPPIEGLIIA